MENFSRVTEKISQWCIMACLLGRAGVVNGATFSATPSTISNTYPGAITLQIGGLTNGESVVLQKFTDVNANGVIDAADWLILQVKLTDGAAEVIGGVTNLNVPYDTTAADGAITAQPSFLTAGIAPQFVGKYLHRLSSPGGRFTPITNSFTVTNFAYAQSFTGNVRSSGTNVPYAGVIVFAPSPSGEGLGTPVAGTMADNTGAYTVKLPPGTYLPWALQNGYVADLSTSPVLTLGAGTTITTNLSLLPGTRTISGRVVDAANASLGLPAILAAWSSSDGRIAVQFADADGNFNSTVTPGQWQFGGDDAPFTMLGYLQLDDWLGVDTTAGNVSGVTIAVPKGTALFYGSVKDDQDHPLPRISLTGRNNQGNGPLESAATTDQNGRYRMVVNAGTWGIEADGDTGGAVGYIFSPPASADLAFTNGQVVQQDFTALLANHHISGWVRQTNGNPIVGINVWAHANIAGQDYANYARTDSAGNYELAVANGFWTVGVDCSGGENSLPSYGNYQCPQNQVVNIANNNGLAEFTVRPPEPLAITTTSLPDGAADTFYSQQLTASGGQQPYHWYLPGGTISLPPGTMNLSDDGLLTGIPYTAGDYNFWVGVWNSDWTLQVTQLLSLTINVSSTLAVITTSLPPGTNGALYSQQLNATGGQPPYTWSLSPGSASLPPNLFLATNGILSGMPAVGGSSGYYFFVRVTDAAMNTADQFLSLDVYYAAPRITTASLPSGTVSGSYAAQLEAAGGLPPYGWSLALGSANLPPNLLLGTNGIISGTCNAAGTYPFIVRLVDATQTSLFKQLQIVVNPRPTLSSPVRTAPNQFRFQVNGVAGQNYTIQASSNLLTWTSIIVTNPQTGAFLVTLGKATNGVSFYRVMVGP